MLIRLATPGDFLEIAALDRQAWGAGELERYIPDGEHAWRLWTEHALVYCAESHGTITGAVLAFPCLDGTFCVHKVFVSEKHRGAGVGSRLLERALEETDRRGVRTFLTVNPENKQAIAVYEKWGFENSQLVEGYYRPEEHRCIFIREPQ